MTFFIEPLKAKAPCIVLGAGHIGTALAAMASQSGFDLHLCDPRSELLHAERLPHAASLHQGYDETALQALPFGPDAFVVIATHSHQNDQDLVETLLMRPFRYLALVGSERKAAMTKQRCLNKGLSEADLARLHCPAGLAIAAQTPEEIAVSILAQMIQVKNSGH